MHHREVGEYWNGNAEAWTRLSRAGYDVYRDWLNTPGFLEMLPNVSGLRGLDLGCGEGHNTRLVAERGAQMVAVDIASTFIKHARSADAEHRLERSHDSTEVESGREVANESAEVERNWGVATESVVDRDPVRAVENASLGDESALAEGNPRNELPSREGVFTAGIEYAVASAAQLPFPEGTFDFGTAFMSLMDIPETERAIAEAFRVLKPGGFLQFSITHPCFDLPRRRNLRGPDGLTYAIEMGDYFRNLDGEMTQWLFSAAPEELKAQYPKFRVPRFTRTLSQWFNLLLDAGFQIERVGEPYPGDEVVAQCADMQDAQVVAYFLHVRARKPGRR